MTDNVRLRLGRASYLPGVLQAPTVPGLYLGSNTEEIEKLPYHDTVKLCRNFYLADPIAGTVINRMASMSVTQVRNRWTKDHSDGEKKYWDAVAKKLREFFKMAAIEYFVHGLVVPEYTLNAVMGKTFAPELGRKKYQFPTELWARNVENIVLKRRPTGMTRQAYYKVPQQDVDFIMSEGKRSDGTIDKEGYAILLKEYPEYVAAVKKNQRLFKLDNVQLMTRNLLSFDDYPVPFLRNALNALQHKEYLKKMDRSIASRAISAMRHVRVGNDDFPADDDDINDAKTALNTAAGYGDAVFTLYTNHTWQVDWVFPPLDVLMNEAKYAEPNADIFLAMGFPRVLTVGETAKSNSSDSKIALIGPVSTLNDLREELLQWAEWLYDILAEANNMIAPQPYLSPIPIQDITSLIQFASVARDEQAISRDVISQLYGSTFEAEVAKMQEEESMLEETGLKIDPLDLANQMGGDNPNQPGQPNNKPANDKPTPKQGE